MIYGIWWGGVNYSDEGTLSDREKNLERWANLTDAKQAIVSRGESGWLPCQFDYVNTSRHMMFDQPPECYCAECNCVGLPELECDAGCHKTGRVKTACPTVNLRQSRIDLYIPTIGPEYNNAHPFGHHHIGEPYAQLVVGPREGISLVHPGHFANWGLATDCDGSGSV